MESARRGASGMDAERGAMGHGCPFATTPGAAPERGKFCEAKPGWWGGLLFGYFFLAKQEKVTRPAGRNRTIKRLDVRLKQNLPTSRSALKPKVRGASKPRKAPCPGNSDAALRRPVTNLSAAMRTGYTHSAPPARLQTPTRPAHAWHRALAESRYGRCSPIPSPVGFQRTGPWHTIGPAP